MRKLFLRTVFIGGLCATALAGEIPLRETAQGTIFGTERFAVQFDARTGWAGAVLCDGQVIVKMAASEQMFDIKQNDQWVTGSGTKIEGRGVERSAPDTVVSRMQAGEWRVDAYLQLDPEKRMLRRWFNITWSGESATKIKGFWIQSGVLQLAEKGGYLLPAHYPPLFTTTKDLVPGRKAGNWRSPYPVVAGTGDGWSAVWVTDELQPYSDSGGAAVEESLGAIRVTQSFNILGHMRQGVTQRVGDLWLWLQPNDAERALQRLDEWFAGVKQVPPQGRPDWLKRVILYSFHPGGTTGSMCQDLGGFQAATALLPHIQGLGCNAIWLMPLEDKSIYWPRDYYKLQAGIGTPADYKAFTAQARAREMRVWQDCVPHGGCNEYPRAKEHPEWLAQNEDGSTLYYWCFDFNWPTWIDYMRGVVSFYMGEYDLDGFRIDACGGSKIPNWNPAIPYARASHAQAQGGFAMQRALREEVRKIKPDGANLAEVGASVHGAVSDSTYDFELCYKVLHDFRRSPADVFVPRLRRWLHEQQCAEVPDLVRMRHVESHDSLRSGLWYGADPQRALVALSTWIHGIPMVYHEMEDGNYESYRRIFHLRRHVAELNAGAADYLSVEAPEGVFACLRTGKLPARESTAWHEDYEWDGQAADAELASVVLVNLDNQFVRGSVAVPEQALPSSLRAAKWARDLMTGAKIAVNEGRMEVELAPFGYTVLRLESRALPRLEAVANRAPQISERRPTKTGTTERVGPLVVDATSGLARAWRTGWWKTIAMPMEIALRTQDTQPSALAVKESIRYTNVAGGVEVRCSQGAALLIELPEADHWFADTAEGRFESPFRVRHPGFDGTVGSIYRLPQGAATLWDSRLHPFGLDRQHARVGAACGSKGGVAFEFHPDALPASVRLLDRIGDDHGLKVLIKWRGQEDEAVLGTDEAIFTIRSEAWQAPAMAGTGDQRLTPAGGGWVYANEHYRAQVSRNGVLIGLWYKQGEVWQSRLNSDGFYTDKGFASDTTRYAQDNDVETFVRIEQKGKTLSLQFMGELRGFGRFEKMREPLRFYTAYTFDEGAAFARTCAFNSMSARKGGAYFALRTRVEGTESVTFIDGSAPFLSGQPDGGRTRYAETAKAKDARQLPTEIRVETTGGSLLLLKEISWFGAKPANVFMHGSDLHLAWLDGEGGDIAAQAWAGVSMNIVGGDGAGSIKGAAWPFPVEERPAALLYNGDFEGESSADGGLRLLQSNRVLPVQQPRGQAGWHLPEGATIEDVGGNNVAVVVGDGEAYRLIRQGVDTRAFKPGTTWKLSARMKGTGVQRGDVDWKAACLRWAVSVDGRMEYKSATLSFGDWEWRDVSVDFTVPEGLKSLSVEAGLNGNAGRVWIDDVRISEVK